MKVQGKLVEYWTFEKSFVPSFAPMIYEKTVLKMVHLVLNESFDPNLFFTAQPKLKL